MFSRILIFIFVIVFSRKQARKGFRPPSAIKGIGYFQNLRNFLDFFWIFGSIFGDFFGGIVWEIFFRIIFWEDFFKTFLEEFFVNIVD